MFVLIVACLHYVAVGLYIHTYRHTYIHTYVRTYIHAYIHTYIHTYIYTYIHIYIHTYIQTWQKEWETTNKGTTTKEYFPTVVERLKMKINLTQNLTTVVTSYGNIKSYLHRFRIIEAPNCPR